MITEIRNQLAAVRVALLKAQLLTTNSSDYATLQDLYDQLVSMDFAVGTVDLIEDEDVLCRCEVCVAQ